ncbi:MAG: hypothetical protein MUO26_05895 [Methanotrichaceae archaeon]|nr:hypothetical protein [Methanotrichaceae archaeon]
MKFNKGFALLAIMAILVILVESYYALGEIIETLLTIGIVWCTLYVALVKKLF